MKTLFFSLFVLFSSFTMSSAWAQTEQGSKLLGGSGSLYFTGDYFSAYLSPNIGFFVADNFVLGGSVPLYYYGDENGSGKQIGLTPFARYYFGGGPTRLFALAKLGYRHNWYSSKRDAERFDSSRGYFSGGAGLGLVHFLTKQIGVEAIASYSGIKENKGNYRGSFDVSLGFQIYLPAKE